MHLLKYGCALFLPKPGRGYWQDIRTAICSNGFFAMSGVSVGRASVEAVALGVII